MSDLDNRTTYWARKPTEEIGHELENIVSSSQTAALLTNISQRSFRAYQYAYGLDPSGVHATSQVLRGGDVGELAQVRVNHSRSLVNVLLNLIVAPKIVWQPKATNTDYSSRKQCDLAQAILEYYWQEKHVSKHAVSALESALFFGEGFVLAQWDEDGGKPYAAMGDKLHNSGDVTLKNINPWDVIRDPYKTSWESMDWVIVTDRVNKYDLIELHPDYAYEIASAQNNTDSTIASSDQYQRDSDDVLLYRFFHKRRPALPNGRQVAFLNNKTILVDEDLGYPEIPLYRVAPAEMVGTSFGYTPFFDTLGVQELMDSLHTIAASNQSTFGGQIIALDEGSEITPEQIGGGLRVVYTPPGGKEPKALQLCQTPPELFNYLGTLKKEQELLIGLNSVVRGEPQSGELSGSALALLQTQALQQSSVIQANYLRFVEGLGTCILKIIQQYASVPQKVAVVGKTNAFLVTDVEYTGDDLDRIQRVQVEIGNPMSQTPTGRLEIAKELLSNGLIKSPEQYESVLSTGKLEPLTQSLHHELLLIQSENEQLQRGEDPPTLVLDTHTLHIREHRAVLSNPEVRRSPEITQAVLKHIEEHMQAYMSAPPAILMVSGQPLPPSMGPPPGPGMGPPPGPPPPPKPPKPPPNMGGPGPDGNAPPPKARSLPPGLAPAPQPRLPSPPKNAVTGRRWDPVSGGGEVPPPGIKNT